MAGNTSLRLKFKDTTGKESDLSFRYAKKAQTGSQVKALGDTVIAQNSIYKVKYAELLSAETVTTETAPVSFEG